jgi:hypothetical protein
MLRNSWFVRPIISTRRWHSLSFAFDLIIRIRISLPAGAVCRGFLHFMDHPVFGEVKGSHPREYMRVGDRVRVWVLDVERTQKRIKLTANRPAGLPGPRREVQWI